MINIILESHQNPAIPSTTILTLTASTTTTITTTSTFSSATTDAVNVAALQRELDQLKQEVAIIKKSNKNNKKDNKSHLVDVGSDGLQQQQQLQQQETQSGQTTTSLAFNNSAFFKDLQAEIQQLRDELEIVQANQKSSQKKKRKTSCRVM